MPPTLDAGPLPPAGRRHTLLIADDERRRQVSTAAWIEQALSVGDKVFYKGWQAPDASPEKHWIAGPLGARLAPAAIRDGQLEFNNYKTVLDTANWTNEGVRRFHTEEIQRALAEGWSSVAMVHDSVGRGMVDQAEADDVAEHEAGYDVLMSQWPLRVLCQLAVADENESATWETVAMHHRDLVDTPWCSTSVEGMWRPEGQIDAYVARRFGAAAYGALKAAYVPGGGSELHVDASGIEFIDVAGVRMLLLVARSAPRDQQLVLHRPSRMMQRLVEAVGRPDNVVIGERR